MGDLSTRYVFGPVIICGDGWSMQRARDTWTGKDTILHYPPITKEGCEIWMAEPYPLETSPMSGMASWKNEEGEQALE